MTWTPGILTQEEAMNITICVPTVRASSVGATIESILRQTVHNWELLVVPQGPNTETLRVLDRYVEQDRRIRYVHVDRMNASYARNIGVRAATGEIIAFTDDDCEVAPNWIELLTEAFETHPRVGIVGGALVAPKNPQWWRISTCPSAHVIAAEYYPAESGFRAPYGFYMIGANLSVRASVARQVGEWDEALGAGARFGACEDQDFIVRAEAMGVGMLSIPSLVVDHTTGRRQGLKPFLKHQRAYALGRGAWITKLQLWNHRLGYEWSTPMSLAELLKLLIMKPHKFALKVYADPYKKTGAREYAEQYVLGEDLLSHRRATIHPAEGEET